MKASIVIVGGGVVGSSVAYHLARRGAGRGVVLLERDQLGAGSTSRSVGGIRSQFSTEVNIRLSLESVAFWRRFEDELGAPCDYREHGYLFLAQTDEERAQFARNVRLQNSLGVASELLEPAAAAEIVPGLRIDDLTAAAWHASDGSAGPHEATMGFARAARAGGVDIREGAEATAIVRHAGGWRVEAAGDRWDTPIVLIAAGPWSGLVGRLAGVGIPVTPYRREIFVSESFHEVPAHLPIVIDLHVGWYFKREGEGILMSGYKDPQPSFDTHVDFGNLEKVAELATHRHPAFESITFGRRAWAGLYDVSPDDHAILGAVADAPGLFLATGFSGHGFQHSPATGRLMAELLLDGRTTGIDIAPLGLDRFAAGRLLEEPLTMHAGTFAG